MKGHQCKASFEGGATCFNQYLYTSLAYLKTVRAEIESAIIYAIETRFIDDLILRNDVISLLTMQLTFNEQFSTFNLYFLRI